MSQQRSLRQILADSLRFLMRNNNVTVTALAKQAAISRGQLNNILTQKTDTRLDTVESLAKAFGTSPILLLTFVGEERELPDLESDGIEDTDRQLALVAIQEAFDIVDDEGKSALLRMATALVQWAPQVEGTKFPRGWRELAWEYAVDIGWAELLADGTMKL